ncbi:MAG: acetyl-CoA carboxylase, carboxyltransferase subunit beta [Candidatus Marinimicrobia bacterium]|nr:acetyl-CoA carboxylase, carboxyltransferase subunit beta [Candidatus Neomarinimicrobiota bacterium]MCF7829812.1 acetyl-CoA carboxylase, carboxyltransferase subunit beta [Candidatus Neomarinimicrobiota bacterium]MCF7881755.1 acetyl-CoA carboxylase, carboxyltransferase subunit beta [Candidatus Neomarinimicrobiota bacterium]
MDWFRRVKKSILSSEKKQIPDGLWVKCDGCEEIIYKKELANNLHVCHKCGYHFRIGSQNYIEMLLDTDSVQEFNQHIKSTDPLDFKASKKYSDQLKNARHKTGMEEAVRTVTGTVHSHPLVMAVMDFSFIGGSMGSVVGEKIARAIDRAREQKMPLLIISSSGGARMMEGAFSLMQMAKTSAKLKQYANEGLPFISLLTHPTTGGVTASFAMLGDFILAEPGALIGFAGPRVIKQTIGQDLPEGFQRAEFLLDKGFVDRVVARKQLKHELKIIIEFCTTNVE